MCNNKKNRVDIGEEKPKVVQVLLPNQICLKSIGYFHRFSHSQSNKLDFEAV